MNYFSAPLAKYIKTDKKTSLSTAMVNDLLEITAEGPFLSQFKANKAVELWWQDLSERRVNQQPRKQYQTHGCSDTASDSPYDLSILSLDEWDRWFES